MSGFIRLWNLFCIITWFWFFIVPVIGLVCGIIRRINRALNYKEQKLVSKQQILSDLNANSTVEFYDPEMSDSEVILTDHYLR